MNLEKEFEAQILAKLEDVLVRRAIRDEMGEEFPVARESLAKLGDMQKTNILSKYEFARLRTGEGWLWGDP